MHEIKRGKEFGIFKHMTCQNNWMTVVVQEKDSVQSTM